MLFRTQVFLAFVTLGAMAVGGALLLIMSSHLNERVQSRTALAHETLSGYFELSGEIYRTFKLVRRDLLSDPAALSPEYPNRRAAVLNAVEQIDASTRAEASFPLSSSNSGAVQDIETLKHEVRSALDGIEEAAALLAAGQRQEGRALAISVLESRVDIRIASLMDLAIERERQELEAARANLRQVQNRIQVSAWGLVALALCTTAIILVLLVRRFSFALERLSDAAQAYADDRLEQRIDLDGQDELSDVARRMEAMADQILNKRRTLEEIRAELEERVEARTTELSEVNSELEERERLRRQFFADIGHELRTPVTAIRGEAEVALRAPGCTSSRHEEALSQIVALTERLTDNVNDLFLLARAQAGMLDFRNTVLDLTEPTRQAISEMRALIEERHASVRMEFEPVDLKIEAELSRLVQLNRILVSNALTHAPPGVAIDIRTYVQGEQAVLSVADNGPGVPTGERKQIFDRYTRGGTASANRTSGTGLGLAIAKSIASGHDAKISVCEAVAGGAEFRVSFPLAGTQL